MTVGERIRHFRKQVLKMTQEDFASKINVSRSNLGNIEISRISATDRVISDICNSFSVSEEWLRTGEGEMHRETESTLFSAFARQYDLSEKEQHVARYLLSLSSEERQQILHYLDGIARAMHADDNDAAPITDTSTNTKRGTPMTTEEIEEEVKVFREALIAEQKGQSASTSGSVAKRA